MHVGSVLLFEGEAPPYAEFVAQLERRLALVPRYRQKLAFPPLGRAGPCGSTIRISTSATTCATAHCRRRPARSELRRLAGRVFSQRLDRSKPLWELWLVERVEERPLRHNRQDPPLPRRRRLGRRHRHGALRPGARARRPRARPEPWVARPEPAAAALVADALPRGSPRRRSGSRAVCRGRARAPAPRRRGRAPRRSPASGRSTLAGVGARAALAAQRPHRPAPALRLGRRRSRGTFKAVKDALRRDGQRRRAHRRGRRAARTSCAPRRRRRRLDLKALVPVSVRADAERGALGNRVAAMYAPLPDRRSPTRSRASARCTRRCAGSRGPGRRSARSVIAALAGFAPPTVLSQAARLQARAALLQPHRDQRARPAVPALPARAAAERAVPAGPAGREHARSGVAIMSYDGSIDFGLVSDYDALPDLDASPPRSKRRSPSWRRRGRRDAARRAAPDARSGSRACDRDPRAWRMWPWPARSRRSRLALAQVDAARRGPRGQRAPGARAHRRGARRGRRARALPRAGAHGLSARGPAAQGALPAGAQEALADVAPEARGHRGDGGLSPSARTTSTTRSRCWRAARVHAVYRKMRLPNYGVFDEQRYFQAGDEAMVDRPRHARGSGSACARTSGARAPGGRGGAGGRDAAGQRLGVALLRGQGRTSARRCSCSARATTSARSPSATCVGGQDELVFDGHSRGDRPRGHGAGARARSSRRRSRSAPSTCRRRRRPGCATRGCARRCATRCPTSATRHGSSGRRASRARSAARSRRCSSPRPRSTRRCCLGVRDYVHKNGFAHVGARPLGRDRLDARGARSPPTRSAPTA